MIEFSGVTQGFGHKTPIKDERRVVLNDVSLQIDEGEIVCLLGPSGCGKTTMVNLIMGITVPLKGTVRVMGELAPYEQARKLIGFMPQDDALYCDITAEENLRFFGTMNNLKPVTMNERIDALFSFTRLQDHRKKLVSKYSSGMKRRLSLAIALLHDPILLVLDEPTVGLDPSHRLVIWDELSRLSHLGKTILVTTHIMDEAARCDRIIMLYEGCIIASDTPLALLEKTGADNLEQAFLLLENPNAALSEQLPTEGEVSIDA
ncbi:MAG: ABC transporter ATP-binding protein [Coriobacteriaceae bacterium]|nr:ABC transporter ATP-binding protein [Coriobacteriaceae bacterium]